MPIHSARRSLRSVPPRAFARRNWRSRCPEETVRRIRLCCNNSRTSTARFRSCSKTVSRSVTTLSTNAAISASGMPQSRIRKRRPVGYVCRLTAVATTLSIPQSLPSISVSIDALVDTIAPAVRLDLTVGRGEVFELLSHLHFAYFAGDGHQNSSTSTGTADVDRAMRPMQYSRSPLDGQFRRVVSRLTTAMSSLRRIWRQAR